MAETNLTPQQVKSEGVKPTYLDNTTTPALSTGDFVGTGNQMVVPNDGKTVLHVKNGHASDAVNVTIQTPVTQDGLGLADRVVAVSADDDEKYIGPFARSTYGDPLKFALDSVTNVSIAVLKL